MYICECECECECVLQCPCPTLSYPCQHSDLLRECDKAGAGRPPLQHCKAPARHVVNHGNKVFVPRHKVGLTVDFDQRDRGVARHDTHATLCGTAPSELLLGHPGGDGGGGEGEERSHAWLCGCGCVCICLCIGVCVCLCLCLRGCACECVSANLAEHKGMRLPQ